MPKSTTLPSRPHDIRPSTARSAGGKAPRPVLKWAGGKTHLLPRILERLPASIDTYYEPFIGGGAVFFALAADKRFSRAVLSDKNQDLIDVYRALRRGAKGVIQLLEHYEYDKDTYYAARALKPANLDLNERAARLNYLNRTGYNGLYRVNRSGQFNVPFGRYVNPTICDPERLRAASRALRGVSLEVADFSELCRDARAGDAVYFDPPYVPLSHTASFTAYHREAFGEEAHKRLAECFDALRSRGVCSVLSNSNTPLTRSLFDDFPLDLVPVPRRINSKKDGRGDVMEILVTTGKTRKPPKRTALRKSRKKRVS